MGTTQSIASDKPQILSDVFHACNPEMLLDVVIDSEAAWEIPFRRIGSKSRAVLSDKVRHTLDVINGIFVENGHAAAELGYSYASRDVGLPVYGCPDEGDTCDSTSMLIPWESFSVAGFNGEFDRRVEARIVHLDNMAKAQEAIDETGGRISSLKELYSGRDLQDGRNALDKMIETNFVSSVDSLIGRPWPEVLKRKIWLPDFLCERELYCVLASVFWAMTYYSFFTEDISTVSGVAVYMAERKIDSSFYADYEKKLDDFVDMLNYNSWVESVKDLRRVPCMAHAG